MLKIYIDVSRLLLVIGVFYFFYSAIKLNKSTHLDLESDKLFYFKAQRITLLCCHLIGYSILFLTSENSLDIIILYLEQVLFFMVVWWIISKFYRHTNLMIWNIALFLTSIGFVILVRLNYDYGYRQFKMALLGYAIALIIPIIFHKMCFLGKLEWVYIIGAYTLLLLVNGTINGAKNWMTIGSFSFQPSEIVKIVFILFLAAYFRKGINRVKLIVSSVLTAGLVMILVLQRDLGTALIFYVIYIALLYIVTLKPYYFLGGLFAGSIAAFFGYKFFYHVKVRVEAWINPWADIDFKGYQIVHSLFAIGAGGWIGAGLTRGMPSKIPVVETDFIFSAICEEYGNIISILLIALLILFFLSTCKMSATIEDPFTFMVSAGLSLILAFQEILIIGGVTKFIPLTGVTLPFISYGGTSLITSCVMIGILQGAYLTSRTHKLTKEEETIDEEEQYEEKTD